VEDFVGAALRIEGFEAVDLRLGRPGGVAVRLDGAERGVVATGAGDDTIVVGADGPGHADGARGPQAAKLELSGGGGDDTIVGGSSGEVIDGGPGADDLTGGGGGDVFVLRAGEVAGDVVRGFGAAAGRGGDHDLLRFEGFGAGAVLANAGGDTWTIGGEAFRVAGVTALGPGDYVLA
jgi:Ca2+-binding RTX toxin-like protein